MAKVNQAVMQRDKTSEEMFKSRYNRDVEVYKAITLSESGLLDKVTVHINHQEEKYVLEEKLKEDQTTDYVLSGKKEDSQHKYNRYLEAEVYIADLIGEKK